MLSACTRGTLWLQRRVDLYTPAAQRSILFRRQFHRSRTWWKSGEQPPAKQPAPKSDAPAGDTDSLSVMQKALSVLENSITNPSLETTSQGRSQVLVIPVKQRPLFPGFYKAIMVKDSQVIAGIKANLSQNNMFVAVFMTKSDEYGGHLLKHPDDIYRVGSLAQVLSVMPGPDGSLTVLLYPHKRVAIKTLIMPPPSPKPAEIIAPLDEVDVNRGADMDKDIVKESDEADVKLPQSPNSLPFAYVEAQKEDLSSKDSKTVRSLVTEVMDALNEIVLLNPLVRDQMAEFMRSKGTLGSLFDDPVKIADFAAAMSDTDSKSLQDIMECTVIEERLRLSLQLLLRERVNAELQHKISQDLQKQVGTKDQEKYLRERLTGIRKELGLETVARDKLVDKFQSRVSALSMPDSIRKVFDEEIGRLAHLKPSSQEYNLTQYYLDWLTLVPWGKHSAETFELDHAQTVLDKEHFGLSDVKDRILEFIAVAKLRGSVEGKIICLVGPPGVGKTSIGKSIAHSLNRDFYRFSVGGLYDVAEIKGHRRTYVGAMPGKLVQALKHVQSANPLILIDEIDKIGHGGHNGDPSSALLEVLDPEQNGSFLDHFMDVPIDLSKVLFVCTANTTDTIPAPLMDRMEVITLSGYVAEEKRQIANKYLVPQVRSASGLADNQVRLTDDAIDELVQRYCRESGVRNLKKKIEQVFRKAALQVVEASDKDIVSAEAAKAIEVNSNNLKDFVGSPVFTRDRMFTDRTPAGVVMGLAYSGYGGASLYIETVLDRPLARDVVGEDHADSANRPAFKQTGKLGAVMKESASIAHSYARHFLSECEPNNNFFRSASIHLHVPEGATPKDGPSAGIAMCTALVSLALDTPVRADLAMTGELTLTGKVLKIGGVKDKVMAAKRSGVKHIILPAANRGDFEDLAPNLRTEIRPHFVETYRDVFAVAFDDKTE